MPKKRNSKGGSGKSEEDGSLRGALGGFFGNSGGGSGNPLGGMFGGSPEAKKEPFGKASAMAAADEDDDDDDDDAAQVLRMKQEEEAAKKREAEAAEARKREEAQAAEARKKEEEAAAARKREEAAKAARMREEEAEAAAAKKKADALKAEAERKKRELIAREAEKKSAAPLPPAKLTTADKVNELLLQHSSKWEVRIEAGGTMAASWVSHVQARALMQQLRLRLLLTPPGWSASERPNIATVVAAGMIELGALDAEQRAAFLSAPAGKTSTVAVSILVHETEKQGAPALLAMDLDHGLSDAQASVLAEGLRRLKNVHTAKKSVASSWGSASRSKDAELTRSVGTMSAMLTAGLFTWDRLSEE